MESSAPTFQNIKYLLNIKIVSENLLVKEFYEKFASHHFGDSGIDLYHPSDVVIENNGVFNFEIQCEMIDMETNTFASYYLVPRSSIVNINGLVMSNSIGVIDAGYRGNLKAKVYNVHPDNKITINKGASLFQIIAPDLKPIKICIVNELSKTTRGENGFGSTQSRA
jgi:dUTP pyrophosphatase